MSSPFIAIDFETELLLPEGKVRTRYQRPAFACMSYSCGRERGVVADKEEAAGLIEGWFEEGRLFVFHNACFDLGVMQGMGLRGEAEELVCSGRVRDTLVMYTFRDLTPGRSLALQQVAWRTCRMRLRKGIVRTSFRPGLALSDEQHEYALQDAVATEHVYRTLLETGYGALTAESEHAHLADTRAVTPGTEDLTIHELDRVFSTVTASRCLGLDASGLLHVDSERLLEYAKRALATIRQTEEVLYRAGLGEYRRKPSEPSTFLPDGEVPPHRKWTYDDEKGCMTRVWRGAGEMCPAHFCLVEADLRDRYHQFAQELGLEDVPSSEKTGQLSLSYPYWRQHKPAMPDDLRAHCAYQKARKLYGTYYLPLQQACQAAQEATVSVAPSFNVGFAETGRWTCSRPNVQNVPKTERDMFCAPPGKVFVSADYAALEMWTLAEALCAFGIEGPLVSVLREGVDLHTRTASLVFEVPENEVTKEQRQGAKACNFGLPGGMGPRKFALTAQRQYRLPWTEDYARLMRSKWFSVYTDVAHFLHLFRVSAWGLVRPGCQWRVKEACGFDANEAVSGFDLSRKLHGGRLYDVRLPSGRLLPGRTYSQAANAYLQGPGAETTTYAVYELIKRGYAYDIAAVVHDSITLGVQDSTESIDLASVDLRGCMARALRTVLPRMGQYAPAVEVVVRKEWS